MAFGSSYNTESWLINDTIVAAAQAAGDWVGCWLNRVTVGSDPSGPDGCLLVGGRCVINPSSIITGLCLSMLCGCSSII